MVKMPILLAGHSNNPAGVLRPLTMGQQWRVDSLSTATMELDEESPEVSVGDWVRVFAPNGLEGVFYVKTLKQDKITKKTSVSLEHTFGLLADMVVFGEKKPTDMGGTGSTVTTGAAITYLLNQQTETLWTLYQNDFQAVAQGWKFTNSQISADLNDIAEAIQDCQWEFDQSVFPWRLSLKAWPVDASMEMRMNRNISTMKVSIDRSRMYTRCYPTGKNNKHIDSVNGGISYLDRNTETWGVVAQVITDNSIADPALLKAWGEKQLKKNAEPAVTVSISGYELSKATGETMDKIVPGRICRVPLPKFETTITERVTELNWKNCMLDEESCTVTLANEHKTIAGVLNEKAGGGGGGKKSNTEHDCELGENEEIIEEFENSDLWVNRESIWAVSGAYTVTTDAQGRHIRLKDGGLLEVLRDGIYETVGTAAAIENVQENVDTITGSALWTQRNNITGVVGEYDVVTDPTTGVKTLVVKSGGGIKIRRDNVEYGLYDNGNLTAGVIVSKINGGTTKISGKNVIIDGDTTINGQAIADSLEGKSVEAGYVNTQSGLGTEGNIYAYGNIGTEGGLYTGGRLVNVVDASVNTSTNTLTITKADGTTINFRKAAGDQYDQVKELTLDGTVGSLKKMVAKVTVESSTSGATFDMPDKVVDVSVPYDAGSASVAGGTGYLNTAVITGDYPNKVVKVGVSIDLTNGKTFNYSWPNAASYSNAVNTAYADGIASVHPTLIDYWSGGNVRIISNPSPEEELNRKLGQGAYTWGGNVASGNIVVSFNGGTTYYSTGATYSVDASGRYNAGWGAAYEKVELPGESMSSSFLIKTPGSTVDGAAIQTAYAINEPVINGANSYIQVKNSGQQVVAQKDIGGVYTTGYSAGRAFEDTKIAGAWNDTHTSSDATYTVSSPLSDSLFTSKVYLTQGEWGSGMKYIYLRSGSTSGTSRARLTVNMPTTATWTKKQTQTLLTATCTVGGKTYTHEFDI